MKQRMVFGLVGLALVGLFLLAALPTAQAQPLAQATATPVGFNLIPDGNMESTAPENYWDGEGGTASGRYVNDPMYVFLGVDAPPCGQGIQQLGGTMWNLPFTENVHTNITARSTFAWTGGMIYFQYWLAAPLTNLTQNGVVVQIYDQNGAVYIEDAQFISLDQGYIQGEWARKQRTFFLPVGIYSLNIRSVFPGDPIFIDDLYIGTSWASNCGGPAVTNTPTSTPTDTPTPTLTPTGTPSPSPTPRSPYYWDNYTIPVNCVREGGANGTSKCIFSWTASNYDYTTARVVGFRFDITENSRSFKASGVNALEISSTLGSLVVDYSLPAVEAGGYELETWAGPSPHLNAGCLALTGANCTGTRSQNMYSGVNPVASEFFIQATVSNPGDGDPNTVDYGRLKGSITLLLYDSSSAVPLTQTPTRTPTAAPTRTPSPLSNNNCGFEIAPSQPNFGWNGQNYMWIEPPPEFGASGPNFIRIGGANTTGYLRRDFYTEATERVYFSWYSKGGSVGNFNIRLKSSGALIARMAIDMSTVNTTTWDLYTFSYPLNANTSYYMEFRDYSDVTYLDIDGATAAYGGYLTCSSSLTPTPTGTWYTKTPTRTPTGTPPTATRTPVGTATRTPAATSTRYTSTPRPTATINATQTAAAQTATAMGTVPATTTATPPAGPGDDCPECEVGEQPPYGTYECTRPIYFWEVSMWVDYTRCEVIRFFTWQPGNNEQLEDLENGPIAQKEPFGLMAEVNDTLVALQLLIESYDFDGTGDMFDSGNVAAFSVVEMTTTGFGNLEWNTAKGAQASIMQLMCQSKLAAAYSAYISTGMCIVWSYLYVWGILQWIQFFFDLACWYAAIRYFFSIIKEATK